jgi:outer membrane protein assembly factor BamA
VQRATTDAVLQWRAPGRAVGLSGRVGLMRTSTFAGTNADRPDTVDRFGPVLDAGRLASTGYVTAGLGALVDHRNEATRPAGGWLAQAVVTGYRSTSGAAPSFMRAAIDARAFRSIGPRRHLLAARLLASADVTSHGARVPYYLQQTLGGTNSLRGYTSYRLRGEHLAHLTVESRWTIHHRLDIVPFVDAGGVGRSPIEQGLRGLVVSPGIGVRMKRKGRSIGRLDVARSREGTRLSFDVGGPF